jgi:hypothetical protein
LSEIIYNLKEKLLIGLPFTELTFLDQFVHAIQWNELDSKTCMKSLFNLKQDFLSQMVFLFEEVIAYSGFQEKEDEYFSTIDLMTKVFRMISDCKAQMKDSNHLKLLPAVIHNNVFGTSFRLKDETVENLVDFYSENGGRYFTLLHLDLKFTPKSQNCSHFI